MDATRQPRVRFAQPGDITQLCELDHAVDKQKVERLIVQQQYIIAEVDDRIVGLIRLEYIWTTLPYMGLIWILPDYRKRGLSKQLLRYLCVYLRDHRHQQLFSSSQANEPEPQAWHRYVGFVDSGCVRGANEGGIDEVVFRLNIEKYI